MSGRNVNPTERLSDFIDRRLEQNRHQNASEVVRETPPLDQHDPDAELASLAAIEAIAQRGSAAIECGEFRLVNGPEDRRALLDDLNRRAAERAIGRAAALER